MGAVKDIALQLARDRYREWCGGVEANMRADLCRRFIETQALIIAPICPHVAEHLWSLLGHVSFDCV